MENSSPAPKRSWYKKPRIVLPSLFLALGFWSLASDDSTSVPDPLPISAINQVQPQAAENADYYDLSEYNYNGPTEGFAPIRDEPQCHPSYSGCLDPYASDYDCAGGSGNGPYYTGPVQVYGSDPFDLDRDGDGWGCE